MAADQVKKLHLLVRPQREQQIEEVVGRGPAHKAVQVDVHKRGHDQLAVEAVHEAAVAGNGAAEVLEVEGALEAAGEEAAEGRQRRGEQREGERVQLEGVGGDGDG